MTRPGSSSDDGRRRALWPAVLIGALIIPAVFGQRLYLSVKIGEREPGIFEILPACMVVVALWVTIRSRGRTLVPLVSRRFLIIWGPYLALLLLLPMIGVGLGLYPLRGLAAIRQPVIAASAVVLGAELRRRYGVGIEAWRVPLAIAAIAQAVYALLELTLAGHLLPKGPWYALLQWDISTQLAYGRGLVAGRGSGFYTNPNILGAWAGIAMLTGLFIGNRKYQYAVVATTLAALVLSQSRGAALGLAASLLVVLVLALREPHTLKLRPILAYGGIVVGVALGWVALTVAGAPTGALVGRLVEALGVLTGGHDPNWATRLQFWASGMALLASHPFGTFGPPEVLLGSAVDSEWVRALLQGGPVLVLCLALALVGGALVRGPDSPERRAVRLISIFIAVAGISQIPLEYAPAILYWALLGMYLAVPAAPVPVLVLPSTRELAVARHAHAG